MLAVSRFKLDPHIIEAAPFADTLADGVWPPQIDRRQCFRFVAVAFPARFFAHRDQLNQLSVCKFSASRPRDSPSVVTRLGCRTRSHDFLAIDVGKLQKLLTGRFNLGDLGLGDIVFR